MAFSLIYHAGIPGRGEFVRLFFEATGQPYLDLALTQGQKCITPYLKGEFPELSTNPVPFAPPILKHNDIVISQTASILVYLDAHLPAIGDTRRTRNSAPSLSDAGFYHRLSLALTILDFNDEIHNTHHPINVATYYEEQKEEAAAYSKSFREARAPKFLGHFESVLVKSGGSYLLPEGESYPDLALFQVVDGLTFAFPNLVKRLKPEFPRVWALYENIKASPRIASYLASDRRQKYSHGVYRHYPELDPE